MSPLELLLSKLPDAKPASPATSGKWQARCPAHDDKRPSLSIALGRKGRAVLHCHAGCDTADVLAALRLKMSDLMPLNGNGARRVGKPDGKTQTRTNRPIKTYKTAKAAISVLERRCGPLSARWCYPDANGKPVGWVVRWNRPNGKKDIRPVSRTADGWIIGGMPEPRPLYKLPALLAETKWRVWVVEGEKAAEAARSIGLLATTSPQGSNSAGSADWRPLAGRDVVILPDKDEAGRACAQDVATILTSLDPPAVVRVLELPDLPPKGDMVEYRAKRRAAGREDPAIRMELKRLADAAPIFEPPDNSGTILSDPELTCLADVEPAAVRWLWPEKIALGKLTVIAGDPGLGKSFLTLDMAALVSSGKGWPDRRGERFEPGGVVLISAEDDLADTIRPRLDAAGADCTRINALQTVKHTDPATGATTQLPFSLSDLPALEKTIERTPNCKLVIVDPISAYLGATDSHNNAEVRAVLAPLAELAARRGVAVVCVSHLNKSSGGNAVYRITGSLAFAAAARAVWAVAKDKDDDTGQRRLFLPVKNNLGADRTGLAYSLRDSGTGTPAVTWEAEPVTLSADDALAPPGTGKPGPEPTERQEAEDYLRGALADGPRQARDVQEEAREAHGIAKRTLDRARGEVRVVAYRPTNPGPWFWRLPGTSPPTIYLSKPGNLGILAKNKANRHRPKAHIARLPSHEQRTERERFRRAREFAKGLK